MTSTFGVHHGRRATALPVLAPLDAVLAGTVHTPDDPAYARLVAPWNTAVPVHPRAVVAARTAEDVATAVRFARSTGLTVGVQATGHGALSGLAGDLLIATRGLDEVVVHPEGWARVGAGVKWARVIAAGAPTGSAALSGSSSDVGVVGYTTGGGAGPMARTYGFASDHVRAFDVVTGDGVLRRVTPGEQPDLFLALRGGQGTAGVVTAVEFDLVHQPTFYGGSLYFDGADAPRVVAAWREWSERLPEEATTSFALLRLPPSPFVPPVLAGRLTIAVRFLWTAVAEDGERLLDVMRSVAPTILDAAALKPCTAVDSVHGDPIDPMPVDDPSVLLNGFPAEAADGLLTTAGAGSGSRLAMVEVRQLGGAYARPPRHPDAFCHREARFAVLTVGVAHDPRSFPRVEKVFAALAPWDTGGVWPNFGPAVDARTAHRAYDPTTVLRLARTARAYDPEAVLEAGRWTLAV